MKRLAILSALILPSVAFGQAWTPVDTKTFLNKYVISDYDYTFTTLTDSDYIDVEACARVDRKFDPSTGNSNEDARVALYQCDTDTSSYGQCLIFGDSDNPDVFLPIGVARPFLRVRVIEAPQGGDTAAYSLRCWTDSFFEEGDSGGGIGEAPVDGNGYRREDAAWVADPVQSDVPNDGSYRIRTFGSWEKITPPNVAGLGLTGDFTIGSGTSGDVPFDEYLPATGPNPPTQSGVGLQINDTATYQIEGQLAVLTGSGACNVWRAEVNGVPVGRAGMSEREQGGQGAIMSASLSKAVQALNIGDVVTLGYSGCATSGGDVSFEGSWLLVTEIFDADPSD